MKSLGGWSHPAHLDGVDAEAIGDNLDESRAAGGHQHLVGAQIQRQGAFPEYVRKRVDQLCR